MGEGTVEERSEAMKRRAKRRDAAHVLVEWRKAYENNTLFLLIRSQK